MGGSIAIVWVDVMSQQLWQNLKDWLNSKEIGPKIKNRGMFYIDCQMHFRM